MRLQWLLHQVPMAAANQRIHVALQTKTEASEASELEWLRGAPEAMIAAATSSQTRSETLRKTPIIDWRFFVSQRLFKGIVS